MELMKLSYRVVPSAFAEDLDKSNMSSVDYVRATAFAKAADVLKSLGKV
jgi:predicted house-cleaning NTP pyrophosphatase (Maf/HAM1 superfamily)